MLFFIQKRKNLPSASVCFSCVSLFFRGLYKESEKTHVNQEDKLNTSNPPNAPSSLPFRPFSSRHNKSNHISPSPSLRFPFPPFPPPFPLVNKSPNVALRLLARSSVSSPLLAAVPAVDFLTLPLPPPCPSSSSAESVPDAIECRFFELYC